MPRWPQKEVSNSEPKGALSKKQAYRKNILYVDPFVIVNADPGREYRFVSKRILDDAGGFDRRGWEALNSHNSKGEKLQAQSGKISSGTDLRYGDLVAAWMPKEDADRRRHDLKFMTNAMKDSVGQLRQVTAEAGAPADFSDTVIQRQGISERI